MIVLTNPSAGTRLVFEYAKLARKEVGIVPRFIVVHTVASSESDLKALVKQIPLFPKDISWKQTYCAFADKKLFCEWEAPSKERLETVFKSFWAAYPFDAVYPVQLFDVAKAEFE